MKHYDSGSLLTMDVMLSQPGEDFEGGNFVAPMKGGGVDRLHLNQGDAVVFISHKYHNVEPI